MRGGDIIEPPVDRADDGAITPLPEPVRVRVVEVASDVLDALPSGEIPGPLRPVAKFTAKRRAKLAAGVIATEVATDDDYRRRVADALRQRWPELTRVLDTGVVPAAADPASVAAAAYLLRPTGWSAMIEDARAELDRSRTTSRAAEAAELADALRGQLDEARRQARETEERRRAEMAEARTENARLRRELRAARERARTAEARAEQAAAAAKQQQDSAAEQVGDAQKEMRQLRLRLVEAREQAEVERRSARDTVRSDQARLRVLLDALTDAAQGLRRELALPAAIERPADTLEVARRSESAPRRGLSDQDPVEFERLLTAPAVHMIVDGYNVTMTGYPDLPLADQRQRLLASLGGLAARTKAEITCVFDGARVEARPRGGPRGVRLLFSAPGQTADELIIRLTRAEPDGRVVVVVTSDQEVIDAARRAGARTAASTLLLRVLS